MYNDAGWLNVTTLDSSLPSRKVKPLRQYSISPEDCQKANSGSWTTVQYPKVWSSRQGHIMQLKGPKCTRLLLQMKAVHSQFTVYRSTAFVAGQCTTVGFNGAKRHSAADGSECTTRICLLDWLFGENDLYCTTAILCLQEKKRISVKGRQWKKAKGLGIKTGEKLADINL